MSGGSQFISILAWVCLAAAPLYAAPPVDPEAAAQKRQSNSRPSSRQ